MEKNKNEKPDIRWKHSETVMVEKVSLELTQDETLVKRVKLTTSLGNITYKPKKRSMETKEIAGFTTETLKNDLFPVSEFIANCPVLVVLAKETKKDKQEITLSYAEIDRFDETDEVVKTYFFMNKGQFETIYYKKFHKDDKANLIKQKENKDKYATKELDL